MAAYPIKESNKLVEEYMLLANFLVAQRLIQHTSSPHGDGAPALVRRHPAPLEAVEEVAAEARSAGVTGFSAASSHQLHLSLQTIDQHVAAARARALRTALLAKLTHPMKPAEYVPAAGAAQSDEWRHYALNIPYYTHFTSPIRRYADCVVHRQLQCALDAEALAAVQPSLYSPTRLAVIAERCNEMKMASKTAQERSDVVFLCAYLRLHPHVGQGLRAVVIGIGPQSFTVVLLDWGLEHRLYLPDQDKELQAEFSEPEQALTLTPRGGHGGFEWPQLRLEIFSELVVQAGHTSKVPVTLSVKVVGPVVE